MGTAEIQGELWSRAPQDWTFNQEPLHRPLWEAMMDAAQYAGDRIQALREFRRVCRPGGRVVVGLFGPPEKVSFGTIFAAVRDALPEPAPDGAGPFELSVNGKLDALFSAAGLPILQEDEVDCPFQYPDFATFWRGQSAAGPFSRAVQNVGKERMQTILQKALETFRLDDGGYQIQPNIFKYVVSAR